MAALRGGLRTVFGIAVTRRKRQCGAEFSAAGTWGRIVGGGEYVHGMWVSLQRRQRLNLELSEPIFSQRPIAFSQFNFW
jgi:hypothetical protein